MYDKLFFCLLGNFIKLLFCLLLFFDHNYFRNVQVSQKKQKAKILSVIICKNIAPGPAAFFATLVFDELFLSTWLGYLVSIFIYATRNTKQVDRRLVEIVNIVDSTADYFVRFDEFQNNIVENLDLVFLPVLAFVSVPFIDLLHVTASGLKLPFLIGGSTESLGICSNECYHVVNYCWSAFTVFFCIFILVQQLMKLFFYHLALLNILLVG